jgi:hypothetical protein
MTQITNQKDLRRQFWTDNPQCARGRLRSGDRPTDTRMAWVDYIDHMAREGTISEALAQRATLDP